MRLRPRNKADRPCHLFWIKGPGGYPLPRMRGGPPHAARAECGHSDDTRPPAGRTTRLNLLVCIGVVTPGLVRATSAWRSCWGVAPGAVVRDPVARARVPLQVIDRSVIFLPDFLPEDRLGRRRATLQAVVGDGYGGHTSSAVVNDLRRLRIRKDERAAAGASNRRTHGVAEAAITSVILPAPLSIPRALMISCAAGACRDLPVILCGLAGRPYTPKWSGRWRQTKIPAIYAICRGGLRKP
jgi:hypothetical protein